MNKNALLFSGIAAGGALLATLPAGAQHSPTPPFNGKIGKTVAETRTDYPVRNPVALPGSPNIVWILLDDTGFGTSSAFGGLIDTPVMDSLAAEGLIFNNFHTAAISTATRACLLTGRNHHSCHLGRFNDDRFGAPGYDTYLPMENGTAAEILRENGYATFCVGKYNLVPLADGSNAGPFNRWPLGRGFDHFYGLHPAIGCDDQWHPLMYRDTHREPDDSLGVPAIVRFTDEAINFIADQKSAAPDQPFFLYFAPGTAHRPFHASQEWIDRYKGRFDAGWTDYARRTLANQLEKGIVPPGTRLPENNKDVQKWEKLPEDARRLYAREMEAFAGFFSQTDHEIGRLLEFIRRIGQLDNTLVILALGDNGATGEGHRVGATGIARSEEAAFIEQELKKYDHYGDERTYPFYPTGWAQACNTPFRYYKKWADYEGGTHDGLIVYYPKGISESGGLRTQYIHAIDILPTTLELAGATVPGQINGYPQTDLEGVSFAYAVTAGQNPSEDRKTLQYYEMNGSYALYKDGWKVQFPNGALNSQRKFYPDSTVHLYYLKEDFNESRDLAADYPEKVQELLDAFEQEAWKHNVYPLKDGKVADPAGPSLKRPHYDIYVGARRYGEYPYFGGNAGKSYTLAVHLDEGGPHSSGILLSQRDFAFYVLDGVPVYATSSGDRVAGTRALPDGACVVTAAITQKDGRSRVKLFIDGELVGGGELSMKVNLASKVKAMQVGRQWGVPLNGDYESPFLFSGKIFKAAIDIAL